MSSKAGVGASGYEEGKLQVPLPVIYKKGKKKKEKAYHQESGNHPKFTWQNSQILQIIYSNLPTMTI